MDATLGKRIAQNRKQLGLTQDQLAEQLGVTAQAVSKWENDQSCPDITMLPRLAAIFGITTDELLGHKTVQAVHTAEVVNGEENNGVHGHVGNWEFKFDSSRRSALCFALTVLAVGVLYLLSNLLDLDASFWEILWPTIPLVYGLFGIYPRFSFFRMGCVLFGGYFLICNLDIASLAPLDSLLFPALVLFGLSLLGDALKKPRKAKVQFKGKHNKTKEQLDTDSDSFNYSASFGESTQYIELPCLRSGSISTTFGSYKLDLSGIVSVSENCSIDAKCVFGELVLLVPARYTVRPTTSTAFAEISVNGTPDAESQGTIWLNASASFGEISVRYI